MIKFIVKTKEIFFMVFFSLLTLSVLNSCSKTNKLDGTTWKGSYSYEQKEDNASMVRNYLKKGDVTISFSEAVVTGIENYTISYEQYNSNNKEYEPRADTTTNMPFSATYTYSKKTVTINYDGAVWIGKMEDKNTMKLNIATVDPVVDPVTLTKQ
jgi:major membrane immunogen (membrane-anchored lipoprotein)